MQGKGAQTPVEDPRNDDILVYVDGELVSRDEAKVSVFDAGFVLGDGIWEGFRLVDGTIVFLDDHLRRLRSGARSIELDLDSIPEDLGAALYRLVDTNGMRDGVHIRLMVTRGPKRTPNQDPRNALGKPTVVIVAEYKQPDPELKRQGMTLFTSAIRCSAPDVFDLRLNSHSRLNLIQALLQAIKAGAHEALMLDPQGFVASCNSTNFFIVKDGVVRTSTGRFNFKGITRSKVLDLCVRNGIPCQETDFTLAEVYDADEAFVTGTFGGLTPVAAVDGRPVPDVFGPMTQRLGDLYGELVRAEAAAGRRAWA